MKKKSVNYGKWGYIFILPFFVIYFIFSLIPLFDDTDETGIFCVKSRKKDIKGNPFEMAALTAATVLTVLIVGIRSRSGKRGDSHKGEK